MIHKRIRNYLKKKRYEHDKVRSIAQRLKSKGVPSSIAGELARHVASGEIDERHALRIARRYKNSRARDIERMFIERKRRNKSGFWEIAGNIASIAENMVGTPDIDMLTGGYSGKKKK